MLIFTLAERLSARVLRVARHVASSTASASATAKHVRIANCTIHTAVRRLRSQSLHHELTSRRTNQLLRCDFESMYKPISEGWVIEKNGAANRWREHRSML